MVVFKFFNERVQLMIFARILMENTNVTIHEPDHDRLVAVEVENRKDLLDRLDVEEPLTLVFPLVTCVRHPEEGPGLGAPRQMINMIDSGHAGIMHYLLSLKSVTYSQYYPFIHKITHKNQADKTY